MRASLLWTISDFSAYSMLSGWSTTRKLTSQHCMEYSDAFSLPNGRKTSWFNNHRKFLPHNHPFRRNKNRFIKNKTIFSHSPPTRSGTEILEHIEMLGLRKVTEADADKINSNICKASGYGWKNCNIF